MERESEAAHRWVCESSEVARAIVRRGSVGFLLFIALYRSLVCRTALRVSIYVYIAPASVFAYLSSQPLLLQLVMRNLCTESHQRIAGVEDSVLPFLSV